MTSLRDWRRPWPLFLAVLYALQAGLLVRRVDDAGTRARAAPRVLADGGARQ